MPKRTADEPKKRATYSITIREWDASAGRFEDKQLEAISTVVFRMATGHEMEMKFTAEGTAIDVRSNGGNLSVAPVASNMLLVVSGK